MQDVETNLGLISKIEPRSINEAIIDESWIEAMKEELHQFEKNEVWNLVPENLTPCRQMLRKMLQQCS